MTPQWGPVSPPTQALLEEMSRAWDRVSVVRCGVSGTRSEAGDQAAAGSEALGPAPVCVASSLPSSTRGGLSKVLQAPRVRSVGVCGASQLRVRMRRLGTGNCMLHLQ